MKNLYLIIAILFLSLSVSAQTTTFSKDSTVIAFRNYLAQKTRYPAVARENNVQGKVILTIAINTKGAIDNVGFLRHLSAAIDSEIVQRVRSYNAIINLPKGQYTLGCQFAIPEDGDTTDLKPINSKRYNNYLFDITIIAYAAIRKATIVN